MSYTSPEFLLFIAVAAAIYRLVAARWRATVLLAASYFFYCTWSPAAAGLVAAATLFTYFAAFLVEHPDKRNRAALPIAVTLLAGYLWLFKIALLLPRHGIAGIVMPLGISYYTFKLIGYLLDVYWGKFPAARRFIPFAAFVAFFPQVVAGPIQRASDFLEQTPSTPPSLIWHGLARIAWGFAKKVLIADNLAPSVNYVFLHTTSLHGAPLLAAFYLYPLQLYADFSALTDIAIGSAQLFGMRSPENFARPFTASNIRMYWQRWHMSLTSWLTDYLFTPLCLATRSAGNAGLIFSITTNMLAIGLWHGITLGYALFGLIHSVYISTDALIGRRRTRFFKKHPGLNRPGELLGCLLTFHLVALALVFFRAPSVADAVWLLTHLSGGFGDGSEWLAAAGRAALCTGLAGCLLLELAERYRPDLWWRSIVEGGDPRWLQWAFYTVATVLVLSAIMVVFAGSGGVTSFLYQMY